MNEKQNKEIAKFATLYLKNRMMINQKLISMGENQIDFETFMASYNKYMKIIDYADAHPNEVKDSDFVEKVEQLKEDFVRLNVDFIVMTEEQIDELMGYIKESIEKYGLNSTHFYNETFFVEEVLSQLVNEMSERRDETTKEKLDRIEKFLSYSRVSENVGFCADIEGYISYDDEFLISTHNSKLVCKVHKDGLNEITTNELDVENLLIADKMYVGNLTSDENRIYIFLEKIIDGKRKMKAISYNQEIYDIYGERNQTDKIITFESVVLHDKINDFFEKIGCSFLSSNIYTKDSFRETIDAFNRFSNMLPDERNEIENIVEIATKWWIDSLSSYSFDSGIEGKIGENFHILAGMLVNSTTISKGNEIQKFKEILGNKIRMLLLSRYEFDLMVDYRPEGELASAVKQSKVKAFFPMKTCMIISKNKIKVRKGASSSFEVIYSKDIDNRLKK